MEEVGAYGGTHAISHDEGYEGVCRVTHVPAYMDAFMCVRVGHCTGAVSIRQCEIGTEDRGVCMYVEIYAHEVCMYVCMLLCMYARRCSYRIHTCQCIRVRTHTYPEVWCSLTATHPSLCCHGNHQHDMYEQDENCTTNGKIN